MSNRPGLAGRPFQGAILTLALGLFWASNSLLAFAAGTTNLVTTADVPAEELAVQCPVVVYARAETNNAPRLRFFVAEVWKGAAEASRAGITNGIELPVNWPSNSGPLPEGAVVFYQRHGSGALQVRSEWMVRGGRVSGMDTNKFKTKCLLGSSDPIDRLVADFSNSHGLWQNGLYPMLGLPDSAALEQILERTFQKTGFDRGHVSSYKVLEVRQVHIPGSLPDRYTAALVQTDLGEKIVLFKYLGQTGGWWSRVYEANRTYYSKPSA
jgi:hypothetical protein